MIVDFDVRPSRKLIAICILMASVGCKERRFNSVSRKLSNPEPSASAKAWVRTLDRDVTVYSWSKAAQNEDIGSIKKRFIERLSGTEEGLSAEYRGEQPDMIGMGKGLYIAFSPVESMGFGAIRLPDDHTPVLYSLTMPKGSTYLSTGDPKFIEAVSQELAKEPRCRLVPFRNDEPLEVNDGVVSNVSMQGLFRTCPGKKREMLKDSNGRTVDFVIFTEIAIDKFGRAENAMDEMVTLKTQERFFWGLLTNPGAELEKRISIMHLQKGGAHKSNDGGEAQEDFECAVELATSRPRMAGPAGTERLVLDTYLSTGKAGEEDSITRSKAEYWGQRWWTEVYETLYQRSGTGSGTKKTAFKDLTFWSAHGFRHCEAPVKLSVSETPADIVLWRQKVGPKVEEFLSVTDKFCPAMREVDDFYLFERRWKRNTNELQNPISLKEDGSNLGAAEKCLPAYDMYIKAADELIDVARNKCRDVLENAKLQPLKHEKLRGCNARSKDKILNRSFASYGTAAKDTPPGNLSHDFHYTHLR